ncbi:MAG TPA: G1 family glutamic endopeptidase [Aliidongia sp.]|nr:G1 family glutamic endopeptidase [Aliidongia sp.]
MSRRLLPQIRWMILAAIFLGLGPSVVAQTKATLQHRTVHAGRMRPFPHLSDADIEIRSSMNWSGYTADEAPPYTSVQGSWVVPNVSFAGAAAGVTQEASSNWVGIGGLHDNDPGLIQIGTEQDAFSDGSTDYFAWFEMLPAISVVINQPIAPGDEMTASVQCVANCTASTQTWLLVLVDQTQGWTFTKSVDYASLLASAEWITEAPTESDDKTIFPLADFSQTTFNSVAVNGSNPDFDFANDVMAMINPGGQVSTPSVPAPSGAFTSCWSTGSKLGPCSFSGVAPLVAPGLVSAMLPSSRSITLGSTATVFATIINPNPVQANGCTIEPAADPSTQLNAHFQITNPSNNHVTGALDVPASIAANDGTQSFLVAMTPAAAVDAATLDFVYSCQGMMPATIFTGINSLAFSDSATPTPDVIALIATAANDGTVHIAGSAGVGAFALATENLGSAGPLTLSVNDAGAGLPLTVAVCQTGTASQCLAPPASSLTLNIANEATPTFSVFVTAEGDIPFSPEASRLFAQFTDSNGIVRGSSSVAVTTH